MSIDSTMQIVRERLGKMGFYESQNKPGLFYRKNLQLGVTLFVDMRKDPIRMYGYHDNKPIPHEEIEEGMKDIKRMLVTIGCNNIEEYA